MAQHVHVWVKSEERSDATLWTFDCKGCALIKEVLVGSDVWVIHEDDADLGEETR